MRKILLFSWAMMLAVAASFAQSVTEPQDGGVYTIQNNASGNYLTWEADSPNPVHCLAKNYTDAQKFVLEAAEEEGFYIKSVASSQYLVKTTDDNWSMSWQDTLPANLTLASFLFNLEDLDEPAEGCITWQNIYTRDNISAGYLMGADLGGESDGLYSDKNTSRASQARISWVVAEVSNDLDFTNINNVFNDFDEAQTALGEEAEGYDEIMEFCDFVYEAMDTLTTQLGVEEIAIEFAEKVMQFRIANASEDYPVEVGEYYMGALSTNGWQTEFQGNNFNLTGNVTNGAYTGTCLERWVSRDNLQTGRALYRVLSELPRGSYTLNAAVMATNQQDDALAEGAYFYANNKKTAFATANATSEYYDFNIYVADGTLEFGLATDVEDANWFAIGDISLTFYGDNGDNTEMIETVNSLIADAQAAKELYIYTGAQTALDEAVAAGSAAIESGNIDTMAAACAQLNEAIAAAKSSAAAYEKFAAKLEEALELDLEEGEAADAYTAAIQAQQDIYDAQSADDEGVAAAITAISYAINSYNFAGTTADDPLDVTYLLANADMESGTSGWTWISTDSHKTNTTSYSGFSGTFLEQWVASSTSNPKHLSDWDIYQTLTGMPAGTYSLTAYINACNQGYEDPSAVHGAQLYANGEAVDVATGNGQPKLFSVLIYNDCDTLRVGFRGVDHDINWWAWDNVTLSYCGNVDARVDAEKAILNSTIESIVEQMTLAAEIKGDAPLQMATAAFDALQAAVEAAEAAGAAATTVEEVKAAEAELDAAYTTFKATKVNAPDPRAIYVLHNAGAEALGFSYVLDATGDVEGDAIVNLNEYVEGNECQQFIFFSARADAPRPYLLRSVAGKFVTMKGTDRWTMDLRDEIVIDSLATTLDSASYDINWVAGTSYTLSTKSGYLGINTLADGVYEIDPQTPIYADKKASSDLSYWRIEKVGDTGIESVNAQNTAIVLENGRLTVLAAEEQNVSVYNLAGVRLSHGTTGAALDLSNAPAGVYIVKVGNGAVAKIMKN